MARPFVFFSIIMILKSYLAWSVLFDSLMSWKTFMTELPFVWLLFCLVEWFASKRKLGFYLAINLVVTGIFFAVVMYYKYYGVIVTYRALEQVNQVTAVKNSVFSLIHPYYLLIFTDVIVLAVYLFKSKKARIWKQFAARKERRGLVTALFTLSLVLCLFNVLPNRASMSELKKAEEMGILNYEAYTILSKNEQVHVDPKEITQARINELKNIQESQSPAFSKAAQGKNLIVIQLESFQNFLLDLKVDGQEVTPVLNRLAKDNFYFPNFYQQVGQGNTSDAEFVVNTSFYIPVHGAATMMYANKELPSLPKLLKEQGYQTATFHTNVVEFWNRSGLYKAVGFDKYYDQSFFGSEDTVFFGPSDEVLYRKTAEELAKMQESGKPFYTQVISMTAHHPFTTPPEKDKITLPERYQDTMVGDYLRSQSYADYALGQFIDELKKNGVWDNSLVVVYGDHVGLPIYSLTRAEKKLMTEIYGREYRAADMINVPLIIASPGITEPKVFPQVGGQVDVLPTVANLMGASLGHQLHFGQDLLNQTNNLLPQRYYLPSGSVVGDSRLFIPGNGYEDGTQYMLRDGDESGPDVSEDEFERALNLLRLSDSYVSQLPNLPDAPAGK